LKGLILILLLGVTAFVAQGAIHGLEEVTSVLKSGNSLSSKCWKLHRGYINKVDQVESVKLVLRVRDHNILYDIGYEVAGRYVIGKCSSDINYASTSRK
jgi:hypothetical protein